MRFLRFAVHPEERSSGGKASIVLAAFALLLSSPGLHSTPAVFARALQETTVLAGANKPASTDERDDGYLTAEEISFLDLSNLDLVVLSACETALGTPEAGEGMLGLRRTSRQAGARAVISSPVECQRRIDEPADADALRAHVERRRLAMTDGRLRFPVLPHRVRIRP